MEKKELSARQLRERKFLFRAPLVGAPLLALLFGAVGGGGGIHIGDTTSAADLVKAGFNTVLPLAHPPNKVGWDKAKYYEHAKEDSLAQLQHQKEADNAAERAGIGVAAVPRDTVVERVQGKIDEIKRKIAQGPPISSAPRRGNGYDEARSDEDVGKLERIIGVTKKREKEKEAEKEPDPEMAQLSGVLDKLLAAEHPERARDSIRKVEVDAALAVRVVDSAEARSPPEIEALSPDDQVLSSGGRIRLELGQDLLVGRQLIPRGSPVYGSASLSGERLMVTIRSIAWEEHVFPVSLQVYDQDGLAGIYIRDLPGTESLRESAGQDAGSLGVGVFSPTLAGQAAGAGIEAARSLVGKKIRRVRVVVPADYRLILKDGHKINGL